MKILHYFLGFPPYRTGGLTKYAYDLMCAQVDKGDQVTALWPGMIELKKNNPKIKERKEKKGIYNYELVNPLPVSLDEGIKEISEFTRTCDINIYIDFLKKIEPEVIHVHTLMGLHKEFVEAARELKIRVVFTTHDYFGLCPKVTLYKGSEACDNDHCCNDCINCNKGALSLKKIWLMQSPIYRSLKNTKVVKILRKRHRNNFFNYETLTSQIPLNDNISKKYRDLRKYYIEMLSLMSCIHFNSTVAENVYKRYFLPVESTVISIIHKDISDNREKNAWNFTGKLRITSLAPAKPYKGYNIMCEALDELWQDGARNFELKIFSPVPLKKPYMTVCEKGFIYSQLSTIMADTDILIAPSIWYETFGFTVLEALSFGVPVIVSDRVGAKDIVGDCGFVVKSNDKNSLKNVILELNEEKLKELRDNIKYNFHLKNWRQFLFEIDNLYKSNN